MEKSAPLPIVAVVRADEPFQYRIRWLTYALVCLSVLLIAKGSIQFLSPDRGQDFSYRWSGQQYVFAGIDPFRVAFWTNEHKGKLPPELPPKVAARAGNPVNIVDPPWVFAYGALIYWPHGPWAKLWFLLLNCAALVLLVALVHRLNHDLHPSYRLFCTALFFANLAFSQQLINGNYGILALAAVMLCFVALRFQSSVLAGVAFALAQLKMTIGFPLSILLLVRRRIMALVIAGLILVGCSLWTSRAVGVSILGLLARMLDGADRFSTGGHTLYQILPLFGVPKKWALTLCAGFVLGIGVWIARYFRDDDFAQMAIFAVCARIFTYHGVIDDVVIALLILAAARTWIESGLDRRVGSVSGVLVGSVLLPGRISSTLAAQVVLQLVWCASLAVVLKARYRSSEACTKGPVLPITRTDPVDFQLRERIP